MGIVRVGKSGKKLPKKILNHYCSLRRVHINGKMARHGVAQVYVRVCRTHACLTSVLMSTVAHFSAHSSIISSIATIEWKR